MDFSVIAIITGCVLAAGIVYAFRKVSEPPQIDHRTIGTDEEDDYYR